MGWYLKKSFAFGPLRLNLSKSGLGASVGVKGLRVSSGPKGKQINAGREGLYYRASLNPLKRSVHDSAEPELIEPGVGAADNDAASINAAKAAEPAARREGLRIGQLLRGILGGLLRGR